MWVGSQRSLTWICKEHMKSWMNAYCWRRQQPMPLPMGNCQSLPPGWVQILAMCTGVYQPLTSVCKEAHCKLLAPWCLQPETAAHRDPPLHLSHSLDSEQHTVQGQPSCCLTIRVHADCLSRAFLHLCVWFFLRVCSSFSCLPHQMSRAKPH